MRTIAIVPAAGEGRRLKTKVRKPFVKLAGKPMLAHTLGILNASADIDTILVAAEGQYLKRVRDLVKKYKLRKVMAVVKGGKTRLESVRNCLKNIKKRYDIVLIHDAARPFLEKSFIKDSIRLAAKYGGCITAVPETDTVKFVEKDLFVKKTLDRARTYRAQTPQTFRYDLIKRAYAVKRKKITDDSSLVEAIGGKVKILEGSYGNIKITTRDDLKLAEVLI